MGFNRYRNVSKGEILRKLSNQEELWKGSHGDEYTDHHANANLLESNISFFQKVLDHIVPDSQPLSVIEFGSNVGLCLIALNKLLPDALLTGLEINTKAFIELSKLKYINAINESMFDFITDKPRTLSFTKGVLINQAPELLPKAYEKLYQSSSKYILIAEYYNPTPVEVIYHGKTDALFKRDFAGELMDKYPDVKLVDYGFVYKRDPLFPLDDITWFLMKKD